MVPNDMLADLAEELQEYRRAREMLRDESELKLEALEIAREYHGFKDGDGDPEEFIYKKHRELLQMKGKQGSLDWLVGHSGLEANSQNSSLRNPGWNNRLFNSGNYLLLVLAAAVSLSISYVVITGIQYYFHSSLSITKIPSKNDRP